MANNFDRQATKGLHGLTSANVWNKPPTTICPPANGPRHSAPSSTNSHNPFNIMGKKQRNTGNATSERTLLGRADPTRGPPSKRRKVDDHTFTPVHQSRIRKADRLPLAPDPDPTFVDLEVEDVPSDDLNIRPPHDATSEHETRLSKYYNKEQSSYRGYTVAQDGEEFKEMKARFSNSIDSDPIEEFTPDDCPMGIVKRRVEGFENGPKVDFTRVTTKSKMKGKTFTSGFSRVRTPASASITRHVDLYDSIPIECLYKNQDLVESIPLEKIRMYATPNSILQFMVENRRLFTFPINSGEKPTMMIHPNSKISDSPVIQFSSQGSNPDLVTIRLNINDSDWDQKKYIRFTKFLEKAGVKLESARDTNILWQIAKNNADVLTKETGGGKQKSRPFESYQAMNRSREVQEIQGRRKDRSLGPPPSASSRDSLSTNPGRGGPDINLETSRCASPLNLQFESSVSLSEIGPAPSAYKPMPKIRFTRSRTKAESNEKTIENPEEVILSYPAGLPGAVNITNADVDRLAPGNFLNDTLIEFSLKLWLKDLEARNPELAHQIHVFNSFFYKKLNVRKDSQVAYESIRKWTSKIDIFKKKYIIVPINENMHWYLAIIYEPEHILRSSPAAGNLPRPHTRQSTSRAAPVSNPNSESLGPREGSLETYTEAQDLHSEAEIERSLNDFGSCFITSPDTIMKSPLKSDNHSDIYGDEPMSDVDMDFDEKANVTPDILRLSPSVSDFGRNVQRHRSCSVDSMATGESGEAAVPSVVLQNKPVKTDGVIDATSFYQPAGVRKQYKGKKRVQNGSDSPEIKHDAEEEEEEGGVIMVDDKPKTYIFTFDSLGGRHPQAIKRLSAYLKMEAKDKKGVDNAAVADGKMALVPCQPNYCDCGIYLLHFAKTFMSDATRYATTILTSKPKAVSSEERSRVWCENEIEGSTGRNTLRLRIEELSSEWKKLRIGTQEQKPLDDVKKVQSEESEGEVELVESDSGRTVVSRARKAGPAVRVRG